MILMWSGLVDLKKLTEWRLIETILKIDQIENKLVLSNPVIFQKRLKRAINFQVRNSKSCQKRYKKQS